MIVHSGAKWREQDALDILSGIVQVGIDCFEVCLSSCAEFMSTLAS